MSDATDNPDPKPSVTLSPADAAAFDALTESRTPSASMQNPAHPARIARVQGWLSVLAAASVPQPSADLLDRTLAAVQRDRMKLPVPAMAGAVAPAAAEPKRPRGWWSRHITDVAAMFVAAILLVAVVIPAVNHARDANRRTLCANNLASVGTAFDHYSVVYNHELPSLALPTNANWLSPGPAGHTNTANLVPLVTATYIPPTRLICAGRGFPDDTPATITSRDIPDCGYSYINLFGKVRPTWDRSHDTIILADRNPLFSPETPAITNANLNSPNHAGHGNFVLHADRSATWETSPNVGPDHDNIWTVCVNSQPLLTYNGTEAPAVASDVFLAP